MQTQKAVSAYCTSKQLLSFGFEEQRNSTYHMNYYFILVDIVSSTH